MGDLPQPDNNVLSETLWNSEHSAAPSLVPNAGLLGMHVGPMPSIVTRPVGTCCFVFCFIVERMLRWTALGSVKMLFVRTGVKSYDEFSEHDEH